MSAKRKLNGTWSEPTAELEEDIQVALIEAVAHGDLVVLPTDTVYGIGSDPFSRGAVRRLLGAKGRNETMPPPVLGGIFEELLSLAAFPSRHLHDNFLRLAEEFWPGELTIVVPCAVEFAWDTAAVENTVALRLPAQDQALDVLRVTGPLAVTSANRTGMPPAQTVSQARDYFGDEVRVYVDGGPSPVGKPSTIVDCSTDEPRVLRVGSVSKAQIRQALES